MFFVQVLSSTQFPSTDVDCQPILFLIPGSPRPSHLFVANPGVGHRYYAASVYSWELRCSVEGINDKCRTGREDTLQSPSPSRSCASRLDRSDEPTGAALHAGHVGLYVCLVCFVCLSVCLCLPCCLTFAGFPGRQ